MKRILLVFALIVGGTFGCVVGTWMTSFSAQAQYIAPYSGAVSRANNSKMADIVSVFDFIPVSLQAAIKAGTSTTDVSSYLTAMHAAVPAGVLFWFPSGQYNIGAGSTALTGRTVDITGVTFTGGGSITGAIAFYFPLKNPTLTMPNEPFQPGATLGPSAAGIAVTWTGGASKDVAFAVTNVVEATAPASGPGGAIYGAMKSFLASTDGYGLLGLCRQDTSLSASALLTCASTWGIVRGDTVGTSPNGIDALRASSETTGTTSPRAGLYINNTDTANAFVSGVEVTSALDYGIVVGLPTFADSTLIIEPTHPYSYIRKNKTEPFFVDQTGIVTGLSYKIGVSSFAAISSNDTILYDPDNNNTLSLGGNTSLINAFNNTNHLFRSKDLLTTFVTINAAGISTTQQLISTLAIGTAPLAVTSTTRVANLNVATAGNSDTVTGLSVTAGKTLSVSKSMTLTAADDTGSYTFPTGTKTLAATDIATLSSLTSIGTIGTGVWQGTVVAGLYGGTGISAAAVGDIIYASATTPTWSRLADVAIGSVLVSGGVNTAPTWSTTPILTSITGPSTFFQINSAGANSSTGVLKLLGSTTNNYVGISFYQNQSSPLASDRNYQISTNFSNTGTLDFIASTTNTGDPSATVVGTFDASGNFTVPGIIRANTGFSANGAAGLSTTCTVTAANTYVFTFGLLTTKGANCT